MATKRNYREREKLETNSSPVDIEIPVLDSPEKETTKRKEERQQRRSSFSARGKRASSLKAGSLGLPHPTISEKNFYLHIQSELPMPSRMKTLLAWSIRRNIDRQDSVHKESIRLAKKVEERLFKSLVEGEINTSWYSRPKTSNPVTKPTEKLPNPHNLDNKLKYSELQLSINRYSKEDKAWRSASESFRTTKRQKTSPSDPIDIHQAESFLEEPWRKKLAQLESTSLLSATSTSLPILPDLTLVAPTLSRLHHQLDTTLRHCDQLHRTYTTLATRTFSRTARDPWLFQLDPIFLLRGILDLLPPPPTTTPCPSHQS